MGSLTMLANYRHTAVRSRQSCLLAHKTCVKRHKRPGREVSPHVCVRHLYLDIRSRADKLQEPCYSNNPASQTDLRASPLVLPQNPPGLPHHTSRSRSGALHRRARGTLTKKGCAAEGRNFVLEKQSH